MSYPEDIQLKYTEDMARFGPNCDTILNGTECNRRIDCIWHHHNNKCFFSSKKALFESGTISDIDTYKKYMIDYLGGKHSFSIHYSGPINRETLLIKDYLQMMVYKNFFPLDSQPFLLVEDDTIGLGVDGKTIKYYQ
jgi:hypothetical protein